MLSMFSGSALYTIEDYKASSIVDCDSISGAVCIEVACTGGACTREAWKVDIVLDFALTMTIVFGLVLQTSSSHHCKEWVSWSEYNRC